MIYRRLSLQDDFPVLKGFYEHYWGEGNYPTLDRLPQDGVIAEDEEVGVAGGIFLYFTANSRMAIIGFPVLNPDLKTHRAQTIMGMIEHAEFWARLNGYAYMNTWSGTESVKKYLNMSLYDEADRGVSHFIKRLI